MPKGEALPVRPNLEYLKKLAKQQVAALRRQGLTASLAAAQLTLARKYGFPSWRKLKAHVELSERAAAAVEAISSGDTKTLKRLLREDSNLANTRIDDKRTLLHVATDWPGHFPNNTETIAELIASGADVNAEFAGRHSETPLHWAASSDDVGVIDVLLNHGAPTLRRRDLLSVAVHRCLTQSLLGNGKRRVDWSSAGREQRFGRPLL